MRYQRGIAIGGLLAIAGCIEPHNDVLIFGTNTKFAIDGSASAASGGVPELTIGYKRQEAVWMPLLVNGQHSRVIEMFRTVYNGCLSDAARLPEANREGARDECRANYLDAVKYVGSSGGSGSLKKGGATGTFDDKDAYSVFASFGATFGGNSSGEKVEASGGIAQFFATGVAAQRLGANTSIGEALKVESSSEKTEKALEGKAAAEKARADAEAARAGFQGKMVAALCADVGEEACARAMNSAEETESTLEGELRTLIDCADFGGSAPKWKALVDALGLGADHADKKLLDSIDSETELRNKLELAPNLRRQLLEKAATVCPS